MVARMIFAVATVFIVCIPEAIAWACFLHIGPHKTGSTEIQSFLMANKHEFKKLNYTVLGDIPKQASGAFQYKFSHVQYRSKEHQTSENVYAEAWGVMENEMKACNSNIIVSSEWLPLLNSTGLQLLGEFLKCYETTVIAFHRSRLSLMRSVWSEEVKYSSHTPSNFLHQMERDINVEHGIGGADPTLMGVLTAYAKEFGRDNIHVLSFEGAVMKDKVQGFEAPVPSFVEALGLHLEDAPFVTGRQALNTSPKSGEIDTYISVLEWKIFAHSSLVPAGRVDAIHIMEAMREPCSKLPLNTTLLYPPAGYVAHDMMVGSTFGYVVVAPPTKAIFSEPMELMTLCRQCLLEPAYAAMWTQCISAFDARVEQ